MIKTFRSLYSFIHASFYQDLCYYQSVQLVKATPPWLKLKDEPRRTVVSMTRQLPNPIVPVGSAFAPIHKYESAVYDFRDDFITVVMIQTLSRQEDKSFICIVIRA